MKIKTTPNASSSANVHFPAVFDSLTSRLTPINDMATPIKVTVTTHPQMNAMPLRGPRSVARTRLNATRLNGDRAAVSARISSEIRAELVT